MKPKKKHYRRGGGKPVVNAVPRIRGVNAKMAKARRRWQRKYTGDARVACVTVLRAELRTANHRRRGEIRAELKRQVKT